MTLPEKAIELLEQARDAFQMGNNIEAKRLINDAQHLDFLNREIDKAVRDLLADVLNNDPLNQIALLEFIEAQDITHIAYPSPDYVDEKLKVVNAYYTLFEHKLVDEDVIRSHFRSHLGIYLCTGSFLDDYASMPQNSTDKETAHRLKALLGSNIVEWLHQVRIYKQQRKGEIDPSTQNPLNPAFDERHIDRYYDVWGIARILWFSGDFDLADQLVSSFLPNCYQIPNKVAASFIHALIKCEKYDCLKKHLPIALKEYAIADHGLFYFSFSTPIKYCNASPELKTDFARIYLDFVQNSLSLIPKEKRHKYSKEALDVAISLDPSTRKEAKRLSRMH